jgi:hypothetical protein
MALSLELDMELLLMHCPQDPLCFLPSILRKEERGSSFEEEEEEEESFSSSAAPAGSKREEKRIRLV